MSGTDSPPANLDPNFATAEAQANAFFQSVIELEADDAIRLVADSLERWVNAVGNGVNPARLEHLVQWIDQVKATTVGPDQETVSEDGSSLQESDAPVKKPPRPRRQQKPHRATTNSARPDEAQHHNAQRDEARLRANAGRDARRAKANERAEAQTRREQSIEDEDGGEDEDEDEDEDDDHTADTLVQARSSTAAASSLKSKADPAKFPQLPNPPLRLTAEVVENIDLQRTTLEILAIPQVAKLGKNKIEEVKKLVGSLFDPASYFALRQTIYKIVNQTGVSGKNDGGSSSTAPRSEKPDPPQFLENYLQKFRQTINFRQQTSTRKLTAVLRMNNDMQTYIFWSRLIDVWRSARHDYQAAGTQTDDDSDTINSDSYGDLLYSKDTEVPPEDAKAVIMFLDSELERRREELGVQLLHAKWFRTPTILKVLVAPFLGYEILMSPPVGDGLGARAARINMEDPTTKMFMKLWHNTLVTGKTAFVFCRALGRGALAIASRASFKPLGSTVMKLIVPILVKNHGNVLIPICRTIQDHFFRYVQNDARLNAKAIGSLIQLTTPGDLIRACAAHPEGLKGIFELQGENVKNALLAISQAPVNLSETTGRASFEGNSFARDVTEASTAIEEEKVDDIFDAQELVLEQQAAIHGQQESLVSSGSSRKRTAAAAVGNADGGAKRRG